MSKITQIVDRSAATAWSPVSEYASVIALGVKDSGGVSFEETGGELELYDMNLLNQKEPTKLGSIKTQSRFASLTWSDANPEKYPLGLIAGGMENGSVHVWDPRAILQPESTRTAPTILSFSQHVSGPVKSVQFSPLVPSQLATGGSDGKVLIVDLNEPKSPPFMPCANSSQQRSQITSLAWNTQVAHIVASAARDGTVSIWDIKSRKVWCDLQAGDQAISDVEWNPTQGFHLLTASNDDRNPLIKLWDLRSSTTMPLATLTGHSQGILSMSWCPHDEHLLLSTGKDNRTILWDLYTMAPIGEIPTDSIESQQASGTNEQSMFGLASSQQLRFDVKWSPINRGIVSTASLDRKVQVHSILNLAAAGRPPKWMRPSSSVSCGFGGVIVSCGATDKVVRIRTVAEEPELEKISRKFETALNLENIIAVCNSKAIAAKNDLDERQLWQFMQVIFDADARQQLLNTLGYDPTIIATKVSGYQEESNGCSKTKSEMTLATQNIVKESLMVGNFDAAVDCCFRTGNFADALLLASCGGGDLWAKTQERYFASQSQKRPFLSVVGAIIRHDLASLVQDSDLGNWKETLAILSTYSKSEEFPPLCVALGEKLEAAGDHSNASLCFMCALSLNKAVKYWRMQLTKQNASEGSKLNLKAIHDFVVKVAVFLQAAGSSESLDAEFEEIFSIYAEKLAEQGLLVTAAKYCKGNSTSSKILRDRLYRSKASQKCLAAMGGIAPEFPFSLADVKQNQRAATSNSQAGQNRSYGRTKESNSMSRSRGGNTAYAQTKHTNSLQQTQAPAPTPVSALPTGWIELVDPSSGRPYYANQATGEVSWDKPQAAPVPAPTPTPVVPQPTPQVRAKPTSAKTKNAKMASKYGDGFVTSASHPELASQYGNVGTSNPYHTTGRPGTATVGTSDQGKAPVSGNLDTMPALRDEYQPIPDTLLALIEALKGGQLSSVDKRQLTEAQKAVAIFSKRLALGDISDDTANQMLTIKNQLSEYDWSSASATMSSLVTNEWKEHKEWLKGIKSLVQLATKMYSR